MKLHVIGSSSKGNAYALEGESEVLLLEAGMPFLEVKKVIGFHVSKIVGCLISHMHCDHAKYIKQYHGGGFPIFSTSETAEKYEKYRILEVAEMEEIIIGEFRIVPFKLPHSVENYGYHVEHPEAGSILFMTDFEYCKYNFLHKEVKHMLLECNYSKEILDRRNPNADHVILGHAEVGTTAEFVRVNRTEELRNVILLHLSGGNSDEAMFKDRIREAAGAGVIVDIADSRKTFELSLEPF